MVSVRDIDDTLEGKPKTWVRRPARKDVCMYHDVRVEYSVHAACVNFRGS